MIRGWRPTSGPGPNRPPFRLGTFWAVFGVGAVIGELAAPYLRRWRVWPIMTGIVLGWGLALVPLGLVTPLWAALAAFFAGPVIWGPWMSLSMGVLGFIAAAVLAARRRRSLPPHRCYERAE